MPKHRQTARRTPTGPLLNNPPSVDPPETEATTQQRALTRATTQSHTKLHALARRHGSATEHQRRRLLDAIVLHTNGGGIDRDDANTFLQSLGIGPLNGPGRVTFRLPVAMAMIHEDFETDVGTFQYQLEEALLNCTARLAGYLGGIRIARPTPANSEDGRRHTLVSTDLLLSVNISAYTTVRHLVGLATAMLRENLSRLEADVGILDEPTVHDIGPGRPSGHDQHAGTLDTDADALDDPAVGYRMEELDDGNYINYPLDNAFDENPDEVDPTRPRGRRAVDEWTDEVFNAVAHRR